mmetsp:Transcript_11824/g.10055  ORF Transcript_11824/g.10055 Transcript_11824/m.10055 type:complete len:227 (-) Transcript_11824:396-1076(-)
MHLQDGRALCAHVVGHGAACLEHAVEIAPVNLDAWNSVVLPLQVDILIGSYITGEGVDGTSVVNDDDEKWQVFLGGSVENLSHTPVLRATLPDEDNRETVVVLEGLSVPQTVQEDGARSTGSVGELLSNKRPTALEVGLFVENVHRAARTLARAVDLAEELSHNRPRLHTRGQRVCVLTVVRVLLVALLDAIVDQRGNRLLAVVQVHETTDVALHVGLVAGSLELA